MELVEAKLIKTANREIEVSIMTLKRQSKAFIVAAISAGLLSACAGTGSQQDRNNTAIGAVSGAVIGALAGGQMDNDGNRDRGRIVGALVGAAAGAGIGKYMDNQEQAFRDELATERRNREIEVKRIKDDTIQLVLNNEVSFDYDSARIKPSFHSTLNKMSEVLSKYPETRITIVGHTDSTGSDSYNQNLSEQRASSVKSYIAQQGVNGYRVDTEGRGESQPRATNSTADGRSLNRRVEVFVVSTGT
ncbi:OmpA family protein [Pseudoteredinibacter isoporae]